MLNQIVRQAQCAQSIHSFEVFARQRSQFTRLNVENAQIREHITDSARNKMNIVFDIVIVGT